MKPRLGHVFGHFLARRETLGLGMFEEVACWLDFARDPRPLLWPGAHRELRLRHLPYRQAGFRVWCLLFGFRWVAR